MICRTVSTLGTQTSFWSRYVTHCCVNIFVKLVQGANFVPYYTHKQDFSPDVKPSKNRLDTKSSCLVIRHRLILCSLLISTFLLSGQVATYRMAAVKKKATVWSGSSFASSSCFLYGATGRPVPGCKKSELIRNAIDMFPPMHNVSMRWARGSFYYLIALLYALCRPVDRQLQDVVLCIVRLDGRSWVGNGRYFLEIKNFL